jgi:hypothetical protein
LYSGEVAGVLGPLVEFRHRYVTVCYIIRATSGTRAVEHIDVSLDEGQPLVFELGLFPRRIPAWNGRVRQTEFYCIIDFQLSHQFSH